MAKAKRRSGHGKKSDSPWVGMSVALADGGSYGKITAVYEYGAGEVVDILKPNGKIEMLPLKPEFLLPAPDQKSFILQEFEFTEATPEK